MGIELHNNAENVVNPTTSGNLISNGHHCDSTMSSEHKGEPVIRNSGTPFYIYRQDIVKSKHGEVVGVVTEVAGDSDSDSSDSDDEEKDEDDGQNPAEGGTDGNEDSSRNVPSNDLCEDDPLTAEQVRVLWMDGTETAQCINDVIVIDRGFLHGDYVAAAWDPTGQVGVVVDVITSVDLLTTDGSVIKNVSSRDLRRVRDFAVGDHVVLGPWLGRIDDILDNVTVLFDDGSVCKVMKADPLRLRPVEKDTFEDGHFPYYPGQRVKASSSSVFKNSRWLSGLWKASRLEGIVTKVTVGSAFVYWIASAGYGPHSSTTPAEEQSPKNLKLLSCFCHTNWQLGDWCLLPQPMLSSCAGLKKRPLLGIHEPLKHQPECGQTFSESDLNGLSHGNADSNIDSDSAFYGDSETKVNIASVDSSSCSSSLSVSRPPVNETWLFHRKKLRKVVVRKDKRTRKKEEKFEKAVLIVNTKTVVDVSWQDGTVERCLDSTTLIPIENHGDHEFVCEQYVVEKPTDDREDTSEVKRVGVVKSVNAKERTACVRWLKSVVRAEDPKEFEKEEVVSVYELEGHPDYDYCYGDVVVRLSPVSVQPETSRTIGVEDSLILAGLKLNESMTDQPGFTTVEGASTNEVCTDFSDLSWAGNITGLKDGNIEVTWADGMVSLVGPQAIYVVGRDDDESVAGGSDDAVSWETLEDDDMDTLQSKGEGQESQNANEINHDAEASSIVSENSGTNPLSIPLAAIGFMTRLATGIFSRGQRHVDLSEGEDNDLSQGMANFSLHVGNGDESSSHKSNGAENHDAQISGKGKEHSKSNGAENHDAQISGKGKDHPIADESYLLDPAEVLCSLDSGNGVCSSRFKGFDIAKDPYDHYYLGSTGQNTGGRKRLKKVQQDWNILQNNLPDAIYVRVYEDRMDLLRAVIVGAYGTPYHDGLFFFDFHLPLEYPDVPPSAYYHSGGWRINPNLYEEGKVCLSLLNTWTGRGNEVWDPSSSSILQVLVSLQGLVLNSKPYFNEAGYDKQVGTAEGEKNSLSYNENTFLLNCKTMMYLMRRPPKDFEDLVKEHFTKRGHCILKACDAYMKGYLIGSLTEDAAISDKSIPNANSIGFKLMLAKIVPKLFTALTDVGADCRDFQHLQVP